MSVDQMVSYSRQISRNTPSRSSLPDWVNEGFPFPFHPKFRQLAEQYKEAEKRHGEAIAVLQFAYARQWEEPEGSQNPESIKECQRQTQQAEEVLEQAKKELKEFVSHTPNERIALYEAEIAALELQLLDSHARENECVTRLLDDPDSAKKRLNRIVHGYTGAEAEYSDEQLAELRSLKNATEEIQAALVDARRNIKHIRHLVLEQQRKAEAQAAIEPALTQFNECCNSLLESLKQLDAISSQYGFRVIKPNDLHIPTSAVLDQAHNLIRIHGK